MAVVVSPILLNSVYATVGANPTKLSDFLLAFQNGFFLEVHLRYDKSRARSSSPGRQLWRESIGTALYAQVNVGGCAQQV